MLTLALLRHAKAAVPLAGQDDFDRPLTPRGRDDAANIGRVLAELPIELAIVSAARRARETWEIAAERFAVVPATSIEPALYLCRPSRLIERLRAVPDSPGGLILVGHNPCWREVALWLSGASQPGLLGDNFPTSALALFSVAGTSLTKLSPRDVTLERFVTPENLR